MCGRCRATVIRWLKALEAQGFVRREVVIHGGGDLGPVPSYTAAPDTSQAH